VAKKGGKRKQVDKSEKLWEGRSSASWRKKKERLEQALRRRRESATPHRDAGRGKVDKIFRVSQEGQ